MGIPSPSFVELRLPSLGSAGEDSWVDISHAAGLLQAGLPEFA